MSMPGFTAEATFEKSSRDYNREEHADAKCHDDLAAKEDDQIIVDRVKAENEFVFEARFHDGQVIGPTLLDACLLLEKVIGEDRHERETDDHSGPGSDP